MSAFRGRFAVFALGTLAALAVLEVSLRLASRVWWAAELGLSQPQGGTATPSSCASCLSILVIGDSYTAGFGATPGGNYPQVLGRLLEEARPSRFQVVNGGQSGANSTLARERLERALGEGTPWAVVVLAGGSNALNLSRYYAYTWSSPWVARLERGAYSVRTLRLLGFTWARMRGRVAPPSFEEELDRMGPQALLKAGLRWYAAPGRAPSGSLEPFQGAVQALLEGDGSAVPRLEALKGTWPAFSGIPWALALASGSPEAGIRAALATWPAEPPLLDALGQVLYQRRAYTEAVAAWEASGTAMADCGAGNVEAIRRHLDTALARLGAGIQRDPEEARCYPALLHGVRRLGLQSSHADLLAGLGPRSDLAAFHAGILREERRNASAWMREDLEDMTRQSREAGARVMLQTYPNDNEANSVLRSVALAEGVPLADQREAFRQEAGRGTALESLFIPDGHCNDAGYALMARTLLQAMGGVGWLDP